jgi:hypothetical protein
MGYKARMKEEIEKIDFTFHVVQGVFKAKNSCLEKQGKKRNLPNNITKVSVGTHFVDYIEVESYSKIESCFQHALGLISKAKALSFLENEYFKSISKYYDVDSKVF